MAKKKQTEPDQDKVFEVIPAIYDQFNWPIGWENYDREFLEVETSQAVFDSGYLSEDATAKDFILHQTLNSFKGNSDTLKAFLFLDTADTGGITIYDADGWAESHVNPVKGTLVILKGHEYFVPSTFSKKRRVLELIF
jgi:hypothetical protein